VQKTRSGQVVVAVAVVVVQAASLVASLVDHLAVHAAHAVRSTTAAMQVTTRTMTDLPLLLDVVPGGLEPRRLIQRERTQCLKTA
jgi:hypothetical protein